MCIRDSSSTNHISAHSHRSSRATATCTPTASRSDNLNEYRRPKFIYINYKLGIIIRCDSFLAGQYYADLHSKHISYTSAYTHNQTASIRSHCNLRPYTDSPANNTDH